MNENVCFEMSIPSDNEGFILLKCPLCGELFKLKAEDFEQDIIFRKYCPSCGLVSDTYLTEDIINLAMNIITNYANDLILDELSNLTKGCKGSLKFRSSTKCKEDEQPIMLGIESLIKVRYSCCNMEAKIKPILKMSGSCCPYCGVKNYGDE